MLRTKCNMSKQCPSRSPTLSWEKLTGRTVSLLLYRSRCWRLARFPRSSGRQVSWFLLRSTFTKWVRLQNSGYMKETKNLHLNGLSLLVRVTTMENIQAKLLISLSYDILRENIFIFEILSAFKAAFPTRGSWDKYERLRNNQKGQEDTQDLSRSLKPKFSEWYHSVVEVLTTHVHTEAITCG